MADKQFGIDFVEYQAKEMVVRRAMDELNPSWLEAPELTSSEGLTIHEYLRQFKALSDVLVRYQKMLQRDEQMLQDIYTSYLEADANNLR